MKPLVIVLSLLALFVAVPVIVLGQVVASPDDPGGALAIVLKALGDRSWIALTGGATLLIVWGLRTWAAKWVPWFATRLGGVLLVLACGVLTVIGSSLAKGTFSLQEIINGLATMVIASGVFSLTKNTAQALAKPSP
jgi:hypothetical protein